MIEVITPAGFESFFRELADLSRPAPRTELPSRSPRRTACSSTRPGCPSSWRSTG